MKKILFALLVFTAVNVLVVNKANAQAENSSSLLRQYCDDHF
jgi:hypothetical protein